MHIRPTASIAVLYFSTMTSAIQNSETTIRKILTSSRTIALVGASQKAERPSNYVMKYLLDRGYNVIPINPGLEGKELHGKIVYGSLSNVPERACKQRCGKE
jgi:hypothetical protein